MRDPESASPVHLLAPYFAYWEMVRETLLVGWLCEGDRGRWVRAVIGHALDFRTWRALVGEQGLEDAEVVATDLVEADLTKG